MLRYAITDGKAVAGAPERTAARCRAAAASGVEFLLLREKHLEAGALLTLARAVRQAVAGLPVRVLMSGRVDVALAAGLDGVNLSAGEGELRPEEVRRLMPGAYVSVSCHSLDEVRRARQNWASAILFAPVFGKTVAGEKAVDGVGLEALAAACREAAPVPVFALGGVTATLARKCEAAGAAGWAGIRAFFR